MNFVLIHIGVAFDLHTDVKIFNFEFSKLFNLNLQYFNNLTLHLCVFVCILLLFRLFFEDEQSVGFRGGDGDN